ncbi:FkbM family methyltransferase [Marinicella rhabdoformis]|uniref:FkbM family methyltransferase n=1 Tax=Marinicella rhabdoformis TaxID=2580566 RepID=UPI0012AEC94A|nr:FkbM family methyltransferase [Marinicella rhabdoformis]
MKQKPFGYYKPDAPCLEMIQKCRQLPATWWGKQKAQWLRKKILKSATLPMDLVLDGLALRCYLNDNISERGFVFMPWRFDSQERRFLLTHLPQNGVFVDVGANVGIYACSAMGALKKGGQVLAIEPNPPVAKRLNFNLNATKQQQQSAAEFKVIQKGVSDKNGTFSLYLNQDNLGASSIKNTSPNAIEISCEPLLSLVFSQQLRHIDVMKIDIEGAEDLALVPYLEQAPDSLLPQSLIFEDNKPMWQRDVFGALKSRGYKLHQQTRMNYIFTLG